MSVIVPAFNATAHIEPVLESLAAQTSHRFEVLIVDDGSDDDLAPLVDRYQAGWKLLRQPNRGAAAARNLGAKKAIGEYVAFVDSDDVLDVMWVEAFSEMAGSRPATMHCGMRAVDVRSDRELVLRPHSLGAAFYDLIGLMLPGAYAVRRNVFDAVGGFADGLAYGEHSELGLRLARELQNYELPSLSLDRVLVTKYHDRRAEKLASYDHPRKLGAEYVLETHQDQLARDPALFADYHAVAGVAAYRLGNKRQGRAHFIAAVRVGGNRRIRHLVRLAIALVPRLGTFYWRRRDVDAQK